MTLPKKTKTELILEVEKLQEKIALLQKRQDTQIKAQPKRALKDSDLMTFLKHSKNSILLIDKKGDILDINKVEAGTKKEDIVGANIYSFLAGEIKEKVKQAVELLFQTQEPQIFTSTRVRETGETRYFSSTITPVIENKTVAAAIIEAIDITKEVNAHNELKISEEKFRKLVQNATDIVYRYSVHPEYKHEYISPSVETITGYSLEEFYNDPHLGFKIIHPDDLHVLQDLQKQNTASDFTNNPRVLRWIRKDGRIIWTETIDTPILDENGRMIAVEGISRDITERKLYEQSLLDSENKYKIFVDITQDSIIIGQEGVIKYINPAALKLFGVGKKEDILGKSPLELFHPDYHAIILGTAKTIRETNIPAALLDEKIKLSDGTIIHGDVVITPFMMSGKSTLHVVVREISDRKKIEAMEKANENNLFLARHAELVPGLIFQYQVFPDGRFMFPFASKQIWDTFELTPEDVKYDASQAFSRVHTDDKEGIVRSIRESMKTLNDWDYEFRVNLPSKGIRWLSGHAKPEKLADGSFLWHGYYHDVTERKIILEQINQSLQEKEVLLKEVHHRVKNNLQVISSILNLQSSYVKDEATLNVLRESQNRIKSMAFIHESLYQADNFSSINFSDYVINLLQNLMQSYSKLNQTVKLNVDLQTVFLNLDLAIPCGLIINEIISNALKYAFPENKAGDEIIIMIKMEGDNIRLVLGDNGIGLAKHIDYKNTESLGLQLVVTLVGQLNGSMELDNTNGTKYTILFPK